MTKSISPPAATSAQKLSYPSNLRSMSTSDVLKWLEAAWKSKQSLDDFIRICLDLAKGLTMRATKSGTASLQDIVVKLLLSGVLIDFKFKYDKHGNVQSVKRWCKTDYLEMGKEALVAKLTEVISSNSMHTIQQLNSINSVSEIGCQPSNYYLVNTQVELDLLIGNLWPELVRGNACDAAATQLCIFFTDEIHHNFVTGDDEIKRTAFAAAQAHPTVVFVTCSMSKVSELEKASIALKHGFSLPLKNVAPTCRVITNGMSIVRELKKLNLGTIAQALDDSRKARANPNLATHTFVQTDFNSFSVNRQNQLHQTITAELNPLFPLVSSTSAVSQSNAGGLHSEPKSRFALVITADGSPGVALLSINQDGIMMALLLHQAGYIVITLCNPTKATLTKHLEFLAQSGSQYDELCIFFSGHGVLDHIILKDGPIRLASIWQHFPDTSAWKGKQKLLIVHACRAFVEGYALTPRPAFKAALPSGAHELFSADKNERSYGNPNGNHRFGVSSFVFFLVGLSMFPQYRPQDSNHFGLVTEQVKFAIKEKEPEKYRSTPVFITS